MNDFEITCLIEKQKIALQKVTAIIHAIDNGKMIVTMNLDDFDLINHTYSIGKVLEIISNEAKAGLDSPIPNRKGVKI